MKGMPGGGGGRGMRGGVPQKPKMKPSLIILRLGKYLFRFKWMLLPLCVLVVKEITAGILGLLVIRKTGKVDGAVWHGKATTVSLYSMMIIHLIWFHIPGVVSGILIGACTALALLSAFLYTRENVKKLSSGREHHA